MGVPVLRRALARAAALSTSTPTWTRRTSWSPGEVTLRLYKGSATPVARSSPHALYDRSLASFGESGGEFSQAASPGFIELFTLQSRMAHRIRARASDHGAEGRRRMTAAIYELIGRLVVRFVRVRYRRQIRIAAGIGIAARRPPATWR